MPDWLSQLVTVAGVGVSVYAGIRADLAALHVKADNATRAADKAHERIDALHQLRAH